MFGHELPLSQPAITHGKILVQWLLVDGLKVPEPTCTELKHASVKLFAAHGAANPWARIKGPMEAWLETLQAESTA